jgi:hypothetical protein
MFSGLKLIDTGLGQSCRTALFYLPCDLMLRILPQILQLEDSAMIDGVLASGAFCHTTSRSRDGRHSLFSFILPVCTTYRLAARFRRTKDRFKDRCCGWISSTLVIITSFKSIRRGLTMGSVKAKTELSKAKSRSK